MEQLGQSDLWKLLGFLRDCYAIHEFNSFDDFARRLVNGLPRLIPAAHVTYNEMYPQTSQSSNWVNSNELTTDNATRGWEEHMNEHPVLLHILKTGGRGAMRISDFWSERQLHDTGLHNDFYRHYDIEDALCITLPSSSPLVIGIGWHDDRVFTDSERLMADIVRPHITQAWLNAKLLIAMHAQLQLLCQGIEDQLQGAIACDSECRVKFVTPLARRYLCEYFDAHRNPDSSLPDDLLRWVQQQNAQFLKNDVPSVRTPLVVAKGNKRLNIRLLSNFGASLLFLEEGHSETAEPDSLKKFGLSVRESEVLNWVAQGKTNSEIGMILGISLRTVKKHLEHILQKLGVETRTAAAALAIQSLTHHDGE